MRNTLVRWLLCGLLISGSGFVESTGSSQVIISGSDVNLLPVGSDVSLVLRRGRLTGVSPVNTNAPARQYTDNPIPSVISSCGAKGDGATDDLVAFNTCAQTFVDFYVPATAKGYWIGDNGTSHVGIQIPLGHSMHGVFTYAAGGSTPTGQIKCALTVTPCINLGNPLDTTQLVTNAATVPGNAILHFFNVPSGIVEGMPVLDSSRAGVIPPGAYVLSRSQTTVVINKDVTGSGIGISDSIYFGDVIKTQWPNENYQACTLTGIEVEREAGVIPNNSIGIHVNQCVNVVLQSVLSARAHYGYYLLHTFTGTLGWGANLFGQQVFTDFITGRHIVYDGWYISNISNSSFGGGQDYGIPTADAFVGVTGGHASDTGAGPNSIVFSNTLFLDPANGVRDFLRFYGILGPGQTAWFSFNNSHIAWVNNLIAGDSTLTKLSLVFFDHDTYESGALSVPLNVFNLEPITEIYFVTFNNNDFTCCVGGPVITLTPTTAPIRGLKFSDNFLGHARFHISSNNNQSDVSFIGNSFDSAASVTIGGIWNQVTWRGNPSFGAGALTPTISGMVAVPDYYITGSWTPRLTGSSTAGSPAYAFQNGTYEQNGRTVIARFNVKTSELGGVFGKIRLSNLPIPAANINIQGGTCEFGFLQGLSLESGYTMILGSVQAGGNWVNLYEWGSGHSGTPILSGMLAGTTQFQGSCTYQSAP